jgi:transposase
MDAMTIQEVRQLYEVERLSLRQIVQKLQISRKTVSRIIQDAPLKKPTRKLLCQPYDRLIREWYQEYPFIKATQVYERLKSYGFGGGYGTVKRYTYPLRQKKPNAFHELTFLPGEEAQIDWMEWRFPFGVLYGFVYLLAYSRYLFVQFYPRHSLEFFLDGHLKAFQKIGGVPHRHRYDNLKSVVLKRTPEITFNPQFLEFSSVVSHKRVELFFFLRERGNVQPG